jgi:ribonucleoside-diphosphate reductase alpha chain
MQGVNRPRFLLPERREGWTQEARIAGHKVYLRTGEYPDGTLGEVFIDIAKEGATLKGVLGCFAIAVSKGSAVRSSLRRVRGYIHIPDF